MKNLYKWQKTTLWVIGILTFIAVTVNTFGKEFNLGYFLDLIFGIGLNLLILWLIFKTGKNHNCVKHFLEFVSAQILFILPKIDLSPYLKSTSFCEPLIYLKIRLASFSNWNDFLFFVNENNVFNHV